MNVILLAGGESKRMKQDKAFLAFENKFLIEIIVNQLEKFFDKIIIITNQNLQSRIENFFKDKSCVSIFADIEPNKGPMGGLFTAFNVVQDDYFFLCTCDMPFISLDLINYMQKFISDYDAVLPIYEQRFQPLHCLYSRKVQTKTQELLSKNQLKMMNLFDGLNLKIITEEEIRQFNANNLLFKNINTIEDYDAIKSAVIKHLL